jgi:hypothetical protein
MLRNVLPVEDGMYAGPCSTYNPRLVQSRPNRRRRHHHLLAIHRQSHLDSAYIHCHPHVRSSIWQRSHHRRWSNVRSSSSTSLSLPPSRRRLRIDLFSRPSAHSYIYHHRIIYPSCLYCWRRSSRSRKEGDGRWCEGEGIRNGMDIDFDHSPSPSPSPLCSCFLSCFRHGASCRGWICGRRCTCRCGGNELGSLFVVHFDAG